MVILASSYTRYRYRVLLLLLALLIFAVFTRSLTAQSRAPFVSCAVVT